MAAIFTISKRRTAERSVAAITHRGAPVKVLDRVAFGNFEVVTNGIFFMEQTTEDTGAYPTSQPAVKRTCDTHFATQRSVNVSLNLGAVALVLPRRQTERRCYFPKLTRL